jgi:hypothetical protein
VINASNIFTKELKDFTHLDQWCDDMMESKPNVEKLGHALPIHLQD